MEKVLELIDFSAGYGSGDVIKNISLTLYAGEVTSLIGENGCGKTTLLRCAAGLMKGCGVYLRMGKTAIVRSARENAAFAVYLSQQEHVTLNMNVTDLMLLGKAGRKEENQSAVKTALARFGCADFADKDYTILSGGQKQLVRLCALTLRQGKIVLLDEPDSALDIVNRNRALSYFRARAKETGEAVLMSCHDVNAALAFSDRLVFLKDGKIIADMRVRDCAKNELQAAFTAVFPGTELAEHRGGYILTGEQSHEA